MMTRRQPALCCSLIATIVMACGPTEESNTPTENQTSREVFEDTWSATIEGWDIVEGTEPDGSFVGDFVISRWDQNSNKLEFITQPTKTASDDVIHIHATLTTPTANSTGTYDASVQVKTSYQGGTDCQSDEPKGPATVEITHNDDQGFRATIEATVVCDDLDPSVTVSVTATLEGSYPTKTN